MENTTTQPKLRLSDTQQTNVLALWAERNAKKLAPPSIDELIDAAWMRPFDPRSDEGIAVRDFLASKQLVVKADTKPAVPKVGDLKDDAKPVLTDAFRTTIREQRKTKGPVILARELFNNPKIHPFALEARLVKEYIKTLEVAEVAGEEDGSFDTEGRYRPPRGFNGIVKRISKYVYGAIDKSNISTKRREEIERTSDFLNHFRFMSTYNNYVDMEEKELFESAFISYVHDKPDLTAEEIDAYINLAMDVVGTYNLQKQISNLNKLLDSCAEDSEGKRIAMGLTEAISSANTELHQNKTRQDKLRESLSGKRKDRINNELKQSASILALVRQWRDKAERDKIIKLAMQLDKSKDETQRLATMESLKCNIFGVSERDLTEFSE